MVWEELAGCAGSVGGQTEAPPRARLQAWTGWRVLGVQRLEQEEEEQADPVWRRRNVGGDDDDGGGGDDGDVCEAAGPSFCGFLMG